MTWNFEGLPVLIGLCRVMCSRCTWSHHSSRGTWLLCAFAAVRQSCMPYPPCCRMCGEHNCLTPGCPTWHTDSKKLPTCLPLHAV